jgi:2-polyprenyl-3-methyl-5-hydroxy-6-metoxy-1,4-benzoquinol methylase
VGRADMLQGRTTESEWIDEPDFGPRLAAGTFRFLVPVNRFLGGHGPMVAFFRHESQSWDHDQAYHILDVGCGAGDVARALARWSRRAGYRLRITGVDRNPAIIALAWQTCRGYDEVDFRNQDIFQLDGGPYDYVLASQFLHHFPDIEVPAVLRHLQGLGRRQVVINDLVRDPVAYACTWLVTLLASAVFRHDGRISVRRGFRPAELARLLHTNGLAPFRLTRHFFYRFQLVLSAGPER